MVVYTFSLWILEMFENLKIALCPTMVLNTLVKMSSQFWLQFIQNLLEIFNQSTYHMAGKNLVYVKLLENCNYWGEKLTSRKMLKYIPMKSKWELSKLNDDNLNGV